jgi:outer membrane protein OmpA-like peptidoglycan-associated protein
MTALRWFGYSLVLLALTWSGRAAAAVSASPTTIDAGNVLVGAMGTSPNATLTSDSGTVNVNLVIEAGCTGTFAFSQTNPVTVTPGGVNLAVTFTAAARGQITCSVDVVEAAMPMNVLGTFSVRGTGVAPVIGVTPTPGAFGMVRFNNAAQTHTSTQTFTVANTGDTGTTLTVAVPTFAGTHAAEFQVTGGSFPMNIAAGSSAMFTVTFDPAAAGVRSATMAVASNDPATMTTNVGVSGTGTTGVIAVSDLAFGIVPQGTTSTAQNIAVTNSGAAPLGTLRVTAAAFGNNAAGWFKFNGNGCAGQTTPCTLSPVLSLTTNTGNVPIICQPPANASGTQNATVTFTSDTDDATDNTASLSCTAGRADVMVGQTALMFGDQVLGTQSTTQAVMIANTGNITMNYSVALVGTNPDQFQIVSGCTSSCTLGAGLAVSVTVRFAPTLTTGPKSAILRVTPTNDPDTANVDVALSGTGVAPVLSPSSTAFGFGNVEVGTTAAAQTLTVTNAGSASLTITAANLLSNAGEYTVTGTTGSSLTLTVAPGSTAVWTFACKPTTFGARNATFRLTSNTGAVAGTHTDIALTCTGQAGNLVFISPPTPPDSFDFGGVREGDVVTQNFTLRNSGNLAVSNINVAFAGSGTGYSITAPTLPVTINANSQVTVTARFAPQNGNDGGLRVATFTGQWGASMTPSSAALTLNGDGLTAGYDTSPAAPNALDFGDQRFDLVQTRPINVINTTGAPLNITGTTLMLGTAISGEFTIVSCTRGGSPITCPSAASPVALNTLNQTLVLNVRCDPADRVGLLTATLTVHSDLAMNPDRIVPLRANSVTAGIAVNPATNVLDFGAVDLDATPVAVTRKITLTNTGTATLNTGNAVFGGANLARFSFSSATARAIAPGAAFEVDVTYTPIVERPANNPDVASITFPLTGVHNGPSSMTVMIQGYGADRHIQVAPAPLFPDTFRNPGDQAPVMPITITNTGDATLHLSAVMLTNDPIWTVVNPDPVEVPGQGTHEFLIRFAPVTAGKAPDGNLVIYNNDDGNPMVAMVLVGNGKDRSVQVGPDGLFDLGFVGIGLPVRLSDLVPGGLRVASGDDVTTFTIARFEVAGGNGAFELIDDTGGAPVGLDLAPRATRQFDVVFTPNAEGEFEAEATLYLDMDPTPHSAVVLRGRGLFVDARGGGGCSTGRGTSGGAALLLGVLVLAVRRRRRRGRVVAAGAVVGLAIAAGQAVPSAHAEPTRNLSLSVFDPTPATEGTTFQLLPALVGASGALGVTALVSFASNPLVLATVQNDDAAVRTRMTLVLGGAYAFLDRFEAGARMPLYLQSGDTIGAMMFGVPPASGTVRGDLTLHAKARLWRGDAVGGALTTGVGIAATLPTATRDEFAGIEQPSGRALVLATLAQGRLTSTLNAGGVVRAKAQFANIEQGSGAVWGAGVSYRLRDTVWLGGEVFGELVPGGRRARPAPGEAMGEPGLLATIEALAGVHVRTSRTFAVGVGVGRGLTSGIGSPDVRGVLTLSFTPSAPTLPPIRVPLPAHLEPDRDGDGLRDSIDKCPDEPEDKDGFEDDDGCPDPDNDHDGIGDSVDKCPLEAEDKDGFEDEDGCPDLDNDNDGIPDRADKCPMVPEDKDGFQDADGCPDPDNDGDGLLDVVDKCPNEPETINGVEDEDGCPDRGDPAVVVFPDRLELLETIRFTGGTKLARSSHNLLGQIAATLRMHGAIRRVRLTAHVQPTNNPQRDQEISEKRAQAVRTWLIDAGVDPLRLQASGFGGTKPLVPPNQKHAAALNNRLELIILERD